MWPVTFELLNTVLSVLLCSIAVKLTDDFLDHDLDDRAGCSNFSAQLGPGAIIYGMLSLALAASINADVSIPLFLASYSIGMFNDLKQPFPSGLSGLQESLLVFFVGVVLWGWHGMLFSTLFILAIQLFDDYIDMHTDQLAGYRNLAHRIGKVECLLLSILTLLLSWLVSERLFFPVFMGTIIFYSGLLYFQRGRSSC
ncbi:MAG: hypothetical protein H7X79_08055 [Sporomusaceae bacterium]|nr:hypothetical protein [Sporomusaceae bacterium]